MLLWKTPLSSPGHSLRVLNLGALIFLSICSVCFAHSPPCGNPSAKSKAQDKQNVLMKSLRTNYPSSPGADPGGLSWQELQIPLTVQETVSSSALPTRILTAGMEGMESCQRTIPSEILLLSHRPLQTVWEENRTYP